MTDTKEFVFLELNGIGDGFTNEVSVNEVEQSRGKPTTEIALRPVV